MTDQIEEWLSGGPQLRRVYEINSRVQRPGELPITLVSLEVWEDAMRLVLVSMVAGRSAPLDAADVFEAWQVTDDHGTAFQFHSGGGGGDGFRWYWNHSWRPAPPSDAEWVSIKNDRLGIDLTIRLQTDR